ncbi:CopG family transcriptional regulator [Sinorhizobium meliloti]|uniref:CopG family transcriptional regulator n=1 Tax=Rhizobium meliloti TaxID=382 RepID=UPI0018B09106|nr:CopG family transcriptional regulator [Sinorhizobium meliloti]
MATQQQRSIGEVIFRAGKSVHGAGRAPAASVKKFLSCRVVGRTPVTLEIVSALRDEPP